MVVNFLYISFDFRVDTDIEIYKILVTPNHLMMLDSLREVEARHVQIGDTMIVCSGMKASRLQNFTMPCTSRARVLSILYESDPRPVRLVLTESGTIVVEGVVVSTLETSGSKYVHRAMTWSDRIAGAFGVSLIRKLTCALGSLLTFGDAFPLLPSSLS